MSTEVSTAHVKQYNSNVFHLSQQKGSRLQMAVRRESQQGKAQFFDRIGKAVAQKKTTRHGDTPLMNTPHSRRRVTLEDYEYADLVDDADKIRMIHDPTNDYALAAIWSMGRAKDDEIIAAATGTAYGGEDGGTSVTLANTQKVAAVSGGSGSALNVEALRRAKKILDQNEVDEEHTRYFAANSQQLDNLLTETEVTSSDFNTIKALVEGNVNHYMGFEFIRTERLNNQSGTLNFDTSAGTVGSGGGDADGYDQCFAWAEPALLLSTAKEITTDVGPRRDKSMSTQVYVCMGIGSTRMEDEAVVEVLCKED